MISFVFFDLGGVLIDDFSGNSKWQNLKKELGITDQNEGVFEEFWHMYSHQLCINREVDTLLPMLESEMGLQFDPDYSLLNGFVKRFEKNPALNPVLEYLSQRVHLGILTNMYPGMFDAISDRKIIPHFHWDTIIDSSIVKLQKPDSAIYELARKEANVPAEEILFIENSPEHIKAANDAGWQTFLYDPSDHLKSTHALQEYLSRQEFRTIS